MIEGANVEIETTHILDTPVVRVSGDIDLSTSQRVREVLLETVDKQPLTVVDLDAVGSIDSSGIASLLEGHQLAKKRGCRMVVAGCGDTVLKVLGLAKLDNVFHLAASVEEAIGAAG